MRCNYLELWRSQEVHAESILGPFTPHVNLVFLRVSSLSGAVSDEYLGINFDRYPIMPKKLLTASLDSGGWLCFTARTLSGVGFRPSLVNQYS